MDAAQVVAGRPEHQVVKLLQPPPLLGVHGGASGVRVYRGGVAALDKRVKKPGAKPIIEIPPHARRGDQEHGAARGRDSGHPDIEHRRGEREAHLPRVRHHGPREELEL
ncbi:hypothetical protein IBTHAUMO2_800032 [Nitrosopumilaceae archaeon]|nr:hypothetical protein IBTHAUMO2_800032 [Nitrosopumilaceae archaeon]